MTFVNDDEEVQLVINPKNGDFIFDDQENLRIVGKHIGPGYNNSDELQVEITQYGNDPNKQTFTIRGGNLEIPAFHRFIRLLAAHTALSDKHS